MSPLYHKVLATTLQMASHHHGLALLLGYPVAYALTMSGPKLARDHVAARARALLGRHHRP